MPFLHFAARQGGDEATYLADDGVEVASQWNMVMEINRMKIISSCLNGCFSAILDNIKLWNNLILLVAPKGEWLS